MVTLVIRVHCEDESDLDWLRNRCIDAVDGVIADNIEEGRLDGKVESDWDIEDG